MTVNIQVTFTSGIGTLGVKVFQNGTGNLIEHGSINSSGVITLFTPTSGDVIAIDGVCTGTADISIDVPTTPLTPVHFPAGTIHDGFVIN